ncbi:MAG: L-serine ammonia-lyase, iron-sulfur-dependent, subunit beta [Chloroflexi bacterium]|nr:L-serine ammonia-lyase, iron-sulfur-dependent, subunit beta [Chloroflexota bacterium]
MENIRGLSIFDIIGPIMVGPSSSHTAGAVRLGLVARSIFGEQPQSALIELHGSFAETGRGHGTDRALVAGLLGLEPSDERIPMSFELARDCGLHFQFQDVDLGESQHPNTVHFILSSADRKMEITGSSVGGGMITVTRLDGFPVNLTAEFETLLIVGEDRPGTINAITARLYEEHINVAFFNVARDQRGGQAIMIIETDDTIPAGLVEYFKTFPWVHAVRRILRLKE